MTIATSGRRHQEALSADVFSWSELPELLAVEDLFDTISSDGSDLLPSVSAGREDDEDEEDEDEDEEDDLDEDDEFEDDEEDEEDEDEDDGDEWEEVEDEDDEEEDDEDEDSEDDFLFLLACLADDATDFEDEEETDDDDEEDLLSELALLSRDCFEDSGENLACFFSAVMGSRRRLKKNKTIFLFFRGSDLVLGQCCGRNT